VITILYITERIQKICDELKGLEYSDYILIQNYEMIEGHYLGPQYLDSSNDWIPFSTSDTWGARDYNCWFRTRVIIPKEMEGKTVALHVQTVDDGWDAINPQFILYLDGEHVQGLDVNHREVILSHSAQGGKEYKIDLHAYAGMSGTDQNYTTQLKTRLVVIEEELRGLYFDLQVPLWICEQLDTEDIRRVDMIKILNEAINLLDLRKKNSPSFYESVSKSRQFLQTHLYEALCEEQTVTASVIGHTHIDVAWHWTVAQTRQKVGRSFSTVINLMKQYPEFKFMSSQPQLYEFVKEDYPELYEKIKEAIREGKWETEGAMWLEADCNLTSGESLVRQILYGKQFFKKEFGVDNKVLWLPDVFGYSAALPQILNKSDIPYFMTTKISWNQLNKIPYDTLMWKGIDGSEVLTHFITTTEPYQDPNRFQTTYNGMLHPGSVMGAWRRYQQKDLNKDVLIAYGYGDGGGGVTYEMLEIGRRLEKGIPGSPQIKRRFVLEYFENLQERVKNNRYLPKWSGELYLEFHRGTYTSMARNKRDNRKSELLFAEVEKWSSIANAFGKTYEKEKIYKKWKTILLNQFHDILPGTSIQEVYDVTKQEYESILQEGQELRTDALDALSYLVNAESGELIVYNSLSFVRSDIVEVRFKSGITNKEWAAKDKNGYVSPMQQIGDNTFIFFAKDIPSIGYKVYEIVEHDSFDDNGLVVNEGIMENQFFTINLDRSGHIVSCFDKIAMREVIKPGESANVLQAFEDKPMQYDNWDIDSYYKEKMWIVDNISKIEVVDSGPVRATLHLERVFVDSIVSQYIYIYYDIPRIDFDTSIDWKQSQVLLKVAFPVAINANKATYEIQYGNVERPNHFNTSWDTARFEVCAHKWVDLSDGGYGVSLLNDSKYGHDIIENVMRITLLKSGIHPHPTTDQEIHRFTYSFYPHQGTWREAQTEQLAANLNTRLQTKNVTETLRILPQNSFSFLNIDATNVHIEAIKLAEDNNGFIVRLYESHNARTKCKLTVFKEVDQVVECNLIEKDIVPLPHSQFTIPLTFEPYEIKSIRLYLQPTNELGKLED
jgi:alpha-mannosidase